VDAKKNHREKTVTALIGNEILFRAVKTALENLGYKVRANIESCAASEFAVIGSYFLWLGVVNQVHSVNPSLPLVLVKTPSYDLNGDGKHFYGVIELEENSEMEAREKIAKWFNKGEGKLLVQKGGCEA
jgi:hypothetical protein